MDYSYDPLGRRIGKSIDDDGAGPNTAVIESYVYDGSDIVLSVSGSAVNSSGAVTNRYLHGPAVDQILADEDSSGEVLWALTDHQGSVRDLVDNSGNVDNHITYDAYGKITSENRSKADTLNPGLLIV